MTPCDLYEIMYVPVCVLMCLFKSDGRSKDFLHISQGSKTLSPLLILVRMLQCKLSPTNERVEDDDSSDVDSYSSTSLYEFRIDDEECCESNAIDRSKGDSE